YIREAFLAEATHQGIESLEQLNDLFAAWAEQVANRRVHAETGQPPISRVEAGGAPPPAAPGARGRFAGVGPARGPPPRPSRGGATPLPPAPALAGRRVELRSDPGGPT